LLEDGEKNLIRHACVAQLQNVSGTQLEVKSRTLDEREGDVVGNLVFC
jgi:hypothetical protein